MRNDFFERQLLNNTINREHYRETLARLACKPRPASEYHEDMGPVLWWRLKPAVMYDPQHGFASPARWAGEPPYVGTPNDLGYLVESRLRSSDDPENNTVLQRYVGGWREGYYTHFTPIIMPDDPATTKE